jgi:6-phospho-beta-glucosidase
VRPDHKLVVVGGSSSRTPELFKALHAGRLDTFREVVLVGRTAEAVERTGIRCRELAENLGLNVRVSWDTDLRAAARDATHVLNVLRVGGAAAEFEDRRELAGSGIVGHAASYPEALRHLPGTLAAARTVHAVAPSATFINFANPVSILCEAIAEATPLRCLGICHHAFSMQSDFAGLLNVGVDRVHVEYFGLNHLGWVTDVRIDGESRFRQLAGQLVARRVKAYDFDSIADFDAIPIKHAATLYLKGQVWYVRQNGVRSSLEDVFLRYLDGRTGELLLRRTSQPVARAGASWYTGCIVPFLQTLTSEAPGEHIVTWRHGGKLPRIPGLTAESAALVDAQGEEPARSHSSAPLPSVLVEWLRQVRTSEHLLIRALEAGSADMLVEAFSMHPNVASVARARQFVREHMLAWLGHV